MLLSLISMQLKNNKKSISFEEFKDEILNDYRIAYTSRECSIIGRREVLTGKASFGIFGDGKELPQIAMAKFFRKGDFRSGYYRDNNKVPMKDENGHWIDGGVSRQEYEYRKTGDQKYNAANPINWD